MMHVLVVASEEFVPATNPMSGVFERDQALALVARGNRVGVLSLTSPFPAWPAAKRAVREAVTFSKAFVHAARELERSLSAVAQRAPRVRAEGDLFVCRATNARMRFGSLLGESARRAKLLHRCLQQYASTQGFPDVVHVHNVLSGGLFAAQLAAEQGIPFVVTEHSSLFARTSVSESDRRALAGIYAAAAARIVVSPSLGLTLTQLGLGSDWTFIPNVIAPEFVAANVTQPPAPPTTFLNIGNLDANKGQRLLLRAFGAARAKSPVELRLRIAGTGPDLEVLRKEIDELGLTPFVTLLGQISRERVVEELRRAHALVVASYVETFGAVAIEALASGRPVIATRSGGPESIIDRSCGLLVPPGDVEALCDALLAFVGTSFEPSDLRDSAMSRFGPDVIARKLTNVYKTCLGAGR